ncbi:MAG: chitobiase/beta-hexosaminidase C-terminal domain-containing protein [Actinomycetota bacterium]|nr:chitobiase/beta-hexosaminidase C-terminal domain-containing protein [Actinomycetota bacterium]
MALQPSRSRALSFLCLLALLACAWSMPAGASAAPPAAACAATGDETVATDKPRYPEGDLVEVSGDGYAPGCEVIVRVVRPDGSIVTGDGTETVGSDLVTTAADGSLAYDYRLPYGITGTYRVYVVHPESGDVLAGVEFEDAAVMTSLSLAATGAQNYVFKAGDTINASGSVSNSRYYRFTVLRPDGSIAAQQACTRTTSTTTGGSETVTNSYTVQAGDPASTGTLYTYRLQEFNNSDATCTGAPSTADLQFAVAKLSSYADSALTTPRTSFGLATNAYVKVDGVTASQADWNVTWIPPSGSTSCANTLGTDRPESSVQGRFPDVAGSFLQYTPNGAGAAWNLSSNYDAGATCPAFGPSNDGQWTLRLFKDATHFVDLPAFVVATTPPQTTIDSGPSGGTTDPSPSFAFSSDKPFSSFECKLDGPGATTGTYASCTNPKSYTNLAQGTYTFSVYAADSAGNVDATPATRTFTVDTEVPAVTVTSPAAGSTGQDTTPALAGAAGTAAGDMPTITVNLYAGATVSGSPARTFSVTQSGGAWSVGDASWDAGVPLRAPLPDGVYTAQADQSDANGAGTSNTRTFRVDTTPPTTGDDVPATTQTDDVTVTLTASDSGAGVQATYYTTDDSDPSDSSNPARQTYDPGAKPVLQDGEQIRYYSVDAAGNAEAVKTSGIAKVDRGSTLVGAEGDQDPNAGNSLTGPSDGDWLGYWNSGRVSSMVDPNALDDHFIGGTKEQNPLFWAFQFQAGGVTPAKSNIQAAWTSLESTRSTSFLYMAFKREGTTGNTFLTFELNQGTGSYVNATGTTIPCRTNGDILVSFETGNPPKVTVYKWVSTAPGPPSCPEGAIGTFITSGPLLPSQFQGRMNTAPITNYLDTGRLGTSFATNSFGEAAIDLPAVLNTLNGTPCASFSRVHVHSRSSEQISSQLQDNVGPYPLNVQSCAVTGTKFEDTNADGERDSGEPGIAGFRLYVDVDGDGTLDAGEPSDVSDAAGAYQITGVPAGTYDVREALTPEQVAEGWVCSKPGVGCRKAIEMTEGGNTSGVEFGNWAPATASGTKFVDTNRNGFRDGAEGPLAGGTVYVDYDDDGVRDPGEPFAVTGADGTYLVTGIKPGSHQLRQEALPGYVCTSPSPSCSFPPIAFRSRTPVTEKHFGDAPSGRVSGTKYEDLNADGDRDGGEPGLPGWTVYVDYNGNGSLDTGEPSDDTDASGAYAIEDVRAPGTYRIREVAQAGWTCSQPGGPCFYTQPFVAGTDASPRDFGAWRHGTISGTVYDDLDENGARDGGEGGLGGRTVFVDYEPNGVHDADEPTATTAADGTYTIPDVVPGAHRVLELPGSGWRCTAPATCRLDGVVVTGGADSSGNDFGNATSVTVSGLKWADHDRDGVRDAGEPGLAGWTVYVDYDGDDAMGPLEPRAVTDLDGDYTITRINPNTVANPYAVREVAQAGWTCSSPSPSCEWDGLVIAAGGAEGDRDFGAYMPQSVSGRTFEDRAADGVEDPGDRARPGVGVWVETVSDNGVIDLGEPSAVSDSRGDYVIPDVPVGTFKVRELTDSGWTCSLPGTDAHGCFRTIALTPGGTSPGNDFGAWEPAIVSGMSWEDVDRDGSRGVDEVAAAGVTVVVETVSENGAADPGEPTAVTGADGIYEIGGLPPRATPYRVVGLPPAGHTCTAPAGCEHSVPLLSADWAQDRDFGVVAEASVAGTQFEDLNADGDRDGGEPALSGWTMWVDYDNDGDRDASEPSDTTGASGDYLIDEVRLGSFRVRQEPAAGWTCSYPAGCSWPVGFVAGGDVTGRDFGAWQPGGVSGTVYDDLDRGGSRNGLEPGLATWTVFVDYDGDDVRDDDEPYMVTAGDGTYTIPGVRPGEWSVREELQGQYGCIAPASCENENVTVASGSGTSGVDFGNAEPGVTIEGSVFHDLDADGTARTFDPVSGDPTEPGLPGRSVWLETVAANGTLDPGEPSTVANSIGDYGFRNLNAGSYTVAHSADTGWNCSYPAGCEWTLSAIGGETVVGQDFGEWTSPGISGRVYEDLNADGGRDSGEPYRNGWRVWLDLDDDGGFDAGEPFDISATVGSDAGVYSITGITPDGDTHAVREEPTPAVTGSWTCSEPGNGTGGTDCTRSFLNESEATMTGDWGNWQAVAIAGVKYEDSNADGDRDGGEPALGGKTVKLDPGTPGDASDDLSTVTGGDGSYAFNNLTPGVTYRVYDEGESGWTCSEPGTPCEYSVPTQSGDGVLGGRDFGSYRDVSIAGEKYEDLNADGDRDTGEPALSGRTIKLDPGTPSDASDDDSTTTAADGSYSFASLTPGTTYRVYDEGEAGSTCSEPGTPCEYSVPTASGDGTLGGRDFGAWRDVAIAGAKYEDLNADGDRDSGEPALSGKTIKLDPGTPSDSSDDDSTTTAADGSYSFANLTPGTTYRVYDEGESGWTCSEPGTPCEYAVPTASGDETLGGRDFGAFRPASVAGVTYEDLNADGDRDGGEPGIAGRTIYIDADGSGTLNAGDPITTSTAGGAWSFDDLDPGSYVIREELPDSTWTCSEPSGGCEVSVTVASGDASTGHVFGSWQEVTIGGVKYEDLNADGDRDSGEPALSGRTIKLDPGTPSDASDDDSTTTAADGSYSFASLTPGTTYRVYDEGESGWTCSEPGSPCEYSVPTASGDGTLGSRDFGSYRLVSLAGTKYEDLNADGDRDGGEPALGGRTIKLDPGTPSDSSDDDSTTTAADGTYSFAGLTPGTTYRVYDEGESGWTCSEPGAACEYSVATASGDGTLGSRDFGSYRLVSLAGTKYEDLNADGDRDSGEPALGGKAIKLDPETPSDASDDDSTTTAADGSYSFASLTPGTTYRVYDEGEAGWTCSEPGTPCEYSVPTQSGDGTLGGRDFGAYRKASIAGETFEDRNADGTRDAGEPTVGGRTVYIDADSSGDRSAGDPTTTSGADGAWSFTGLEPGDYVVRSELPDSSWTCSVPAGCAYAVNIESGEDDSGRDFGSWQEVSIAGTKYEDLNADGDRDGGEPALGDKAIKLDPGTPSDASDDDSTTTAADGTYSFANLTPGTTYRVYDEGEAGWTCSEPGAACEYSVPTESGDGTLGSRDFGAWRDVSIAGEKYEDLNADGDRDSGEPALSGKTIKLDPGTPSDASDDDSTTTAADGTYSFANLTPGTTYRVYDEGEAGWTCSEPGIPCEYSVPTESGDGTLGSRDFGAWRDIAIAGEKYEDLNADGDRDAGEPALSGKTIKLDPGTPSDASDDDSTTTVADGTYSFTNLTPGNTYRVYDEGESGWTCSEPGASCEYSVPTASGDGTLGGNDFGAYRDAQISGRVYEDLNADGDRDSGEPYRNGWRVWLDLNDDGEFDAGEPADVSATVGADSGVYSITGITPDGQTHAVREEPTAAAIGSGWICSEPGNGTGGTDCTRSFLNESNTSLTGNYGNYREVTIAGEKYEDLNADGDRDSGEPALGGRTITLDPGTPSDSSDDDSTTTAAGGTYSFANLTPGTIYRVYDEGEAGWTCSEPGTPCEYAVPTASGDGTLGGRDFGAWRDVSIAGTKYEDLNADGDRDSGEPTLSGKAIKLDPGTPSDASDDDSTTTAGDGTYSFANLTPGTTYRVYDESESGWTCSEPGTPCEYSVPTASGDGTLASRDFGAWRDVAIAGEKYEDLNADGDRDSGEPALSGKAIKLDPGTPSDASDDDSTTTAADGTYSFANLTPGTTYRVYNEGESGWTCSEPGASCEYSVPTQSGDGTLANRDFGAYRKASIAGETFEDEDADGIREAGDQTIPNRTVYIDADNSGDLSAGDPTTTSDSNGAWSFTGLEPGGYTVREVLPDSTWHCSFPAGGCVYDFTLVSGDEETGRDFGSWREVTLGGTYFEDKDRDGDRDPDEPTPGGWTITLDPGTPDDDSDDVTTTTDGDGRYEFPGLRPGVEYELTVEPRTGWTCTFPATCEYTLTPGSGDTPGNLDFGAYPAGRLEIREVLDPAGDGGRFDLKIEGNTEKPRAGNGDTTGTKLLAPGDYAVSQTGADGTNHDDYESKLECRAAGGNGPTVPAPNGTVTIAPGDDVVCTFTTTRKPAPTPPPTVDPPAPAPPEGGTTPAPSTEEACLNRPVVTWVRGKGIARVVFYLDGKRKATVTRPDSEGRFSLRTDRRKLTPGVHEVRARVYFKRAGRAPKTLTFEIEPCLKMAVSTKIETSVGALDTCARRSFRAFVRGDIVRRVVFYMDGRKVKSTRVADWKGRYWVSVRPSALSVGKHELRARMYFISGSKQRSRLLKLSFRRCGG